MQNLHLIYLKQLKKLKKKLEAEARAKSAQANKITALNKRIEAINAARKRAAKNKEKVNEEKMLSESDLIGGKYVLLQKGKKNYFLITVN